MGIVSRFERTLQSAVGDTFARVFGGNVVASEIESALQQQALSSVRSTGGRKLVPNEYTITLGESDYSQFAAEEQLAVKTFSKHLADFIAEQGWETEGPVAVRLVERSALHTGQFRADGEVASRGGAHTPSSYGHDRSMKPPVEAASPGWNSSTSGPSAAGVAGTGAGAGAAGGYGADDAADDRHTGPESSPAMPRPGTTTGAAADSAAGRSRATSGVTLVLEDGSGRTYRLGRGSNLLGRGQDADFRLPDTGVSRQHVDIHYDGAQAVLSDLGSTNGTTVNGGPVQDWQLADGDVIRMGHSEILVRFG